MRSSLRKSTEFADEFNFNTIFVSNALCILLNQFRKRLRKTCKIESTDSIRFQITGHAFGATSSMDVSLNNHTIIISNRTIDFQYILNILVARNRQSGNLEIGVPVLGNRLFCA